MIELVFESRLREMRPVIWSAIITMRGVNAELLPLIKMTYPREAGTMSIADAPIGEFLFQSWILAFSFIPIDRHHLRIQEIRHGIGFGEESVTWAQKRWRHERTLEALPEGCLVRDQLTFIPRLSWMAPILKRIVKKVFEHRHRQLRSLYGDLLS